MASAMKKSSKFPKIGSRIPDFRECDSILVLVSFTFHYSLSTNH